MAKAYLAGRMTGLPCFNFPAFHAAAAKLRERGWRVISPAELDTAHGTTSPSGDALYEPCSTRTIIQRDVVALLECDTLILLPFWEGSKGVNAEYAIAEWAGLKILTLEEALRDGPRV